MTKKKNEHMLDFLGKRIFYLFKRAESDIDDGMHFCAKLNMQQMRF